MYIWMMSGENGDVLHGRGGGRKRWVTTEQMEEDVEVDGGSRRMASPWHVDKGDER
jgi:hypothetical protein